MPALNLSKAQPMPKQAVRSRVTNFGEVALGYTKEQAIAEAKRCLYYAPKLLDDGHTVLCCTDHPCVQACPVGVDIPGFIKAVREYDMLRAVEVLKDKSNLPAICGRVCPQEMQCQSACVLLKAGEEPVAIGRLERYVADWDLRHRGEDKTPFVRREFSGKKVAIVGSGPAGLTAAAGLAKLGRQVVIFEALHVAGGVLMYGIPEFRLPKHIVQAEVGYVKSLGVEIKLDQVIGKIATVDELLESDYGAVFLAPGAGAPMFLNIPNENLSNIYSANEFLTRTNLMKAYKFPEYDTPIKVGKRVAVFGAGNVAMDASRCALRLGSEEVYIIYRRSKTEMPARLEERENAEEEGVIFKLLTNPKRFIGDEKGKVKAVECCEMELGEPDKSGRRRPIAKPGTEFIIDIDIAIIALGTRPNPIIPTTTKGIELTRWGTIKTDEATGRTNRKGIWCGGDMATGAATVISAMGAGKRAAADIDAYLRRQA